MWARRSGTSFPASCSCRARVAVEMTTRFPDSAAGTRYASVLPVPVPASTRSGRPPSRASATAMATASCSGRSSQPATACARMPPGPRYSATRALDTTARGLLLVAALAEAPLELVPHLDHRHAARRQADEDVEQEVG